jgi:hypothetical protein
MAASMDITSFVGKLLEQDDVDALREGARGCPPGGGAIQASSERWPFDAY